MGSTIVSFSAPGIPNTSIYANGHLVCNGGSSGLCSTGNWVNDGMEFTLADSNTGVTLASVSASVHTPGTGCPVLTSSNSSPRKPGEALAFAPVAKCSSTFLSRLAADGEFPWLLPSTAIANSGETIFFDEHMKRLFSSRILIAILSLALTCCITAQTPTKGNKYTDYVAYNLFLKNCAFLSRQADGLDAAGKEGNTIRRAVASKLGLTTTDASVLLTVAAETDARIQALDKQAAALIQTAHNLRDAGMTVPPPPEELNTLQQQKTALISAAIDSLHNRLTAPGSTAVGNYRHTSAAMASSISSSSAITGAK
jgi:hypothetical protein